MRLPTAVRSLALFYNKKLFKEAGLDPEQAARDARRVRRLRQEDDQARRRRQPAVRPALTLDMAGQDHQWWREVLVRQFGGEPYTDDDKKVTYNTEAGVAATAVVHRPAAASTRSAQVGFMDEAQAAFRAGRAAMTIDGTFRLGAFDGQQGLRMGRDRAAGANGSQGRTTRATGSTASPPRPTGEKLEAAEKFLAFVTTPEAMELWLEMVGELPARKAPRRRTHKNLADPIYGAVPRALDYSQATVFVDETRPAPGLHRHGRPASLIQNQAAPRTSVAEAASRGAGDPRRASTRQSKLTRQRRRWRDRRGSRAAVDAATRDPRWRGL